MALTEQAITNLVTQLQLAEATASPLAPLIPPYSDASETDMYHVQQALVMRKIRAGDRVVGKKVGATNPKAQQVFGLTEPFYGHVLERGRLSDGAQVPFATLIQPRLECEIVFVLQRPLQGPDVTITEVLAATEAVVAAFEIVDPHIGAWPDLGMRELIADNGIFARCVQGTTKVPVQQLDLDQVRVVLTKNGVQLVEGIGTAVLGHPAASVAWLANKLATHHCHLEAGEIVMAGSLTPIQPVQQGDRFEAAFAGIGSVTVEFP